MNDIIYSDDVYVKGSPRFKCETTLTWSQQVVLCFERLWTLPEGGPLLLEVGHQEAGLMSYNLPYSRQSSPLPYWLFDVTPSFPYHGATGSPKYSLPPWFLSGSKPVTGSRNL